MFDFDIPTKLGELVYYVGWIVTAAGLLALTLVLVWYFLTVIFSRVRGLGRLTEYAVWLACNKKEPCRHKQHALTLGEQLKIKDEGLQAINNLNTDLRTALKDEKQSHADTRYTLELYRRKYGAV